MAAGILYAVYTLFGALTTIYGPTMAYLMQDYGIDYGQAGLLVTFTSVGRLISVLAGGALSDKYGRKPLLIIGIFCWLVGLAGIGSISWYIGAVFFALLIGIGNGVVGATVNGAIADINRNYLSRSLNRLHMFFAIGCTLGPLLSGLILSYYSVWRTIYYIDALLGLIMLFLVATQVFPTIDINMKKTDKFSFKLKNIFEYNSIILIALIPLIYSGVGNSINTWINKYMGDVANFQIFMAAGTLSIYNLGLALGRFVNSIVSEKIGPVKSILFSSIGALIFTLLSLFSSNALIIVAALTMVGFFLGGLTPTAIAILGQMHPSKVGTASAVLTMAGTLGSMLIPAAVGWLADLWDIVGGMRSLTIPILILCIVAFNLYRRTIFKNNI